MEEKNSIISHERWQLEKICYKSIKIITFLLFWHSYLLWKVSPEVLSPYPVNLTQVLQVVAVKSLPLWNDRWSNRWQPWLNRQKPPVFTEPRSRCVFIHLFIYYSKNRVKTEKRPSVSRVTQLACCLASLRFYGWLAQTDGAAGLSVTGVISR